MSTLSSRPIPRTWHVTWQIVVADLALACALGWWVWREDSPAAYGDTVVATAALLTVAWIAVAGALRLGLQILAVRAPRGSAG